jgi:hypothetical protein
MLSRVGHFGNNQAWTCLFSSFESFAGTGEVTSVIVIQVLFDQRFLQKSFNLVLCSFQESLLMWIVVMC